MHKRIMFFLMYTMPTVALALNDKYDPYWDKKGSGKDFVWYVIIVGGIMLINWIINLFKGKKE